MATDRDGISTCGVATSALLRSSRRLEAALLFLITTSGAMAGEFGQADIAVSCPDSLRQYDLYELKISFGGHVGAWMSRLPDTQVHDAYDADRDGVWVRLSAEFIRGGETIRVPGFAMREKPGGPWRWRVRFAPRSWEGGKATRITVALEYGEKKNAPPVVITHEVAKRPCMEAGGLGPLISPRPKDNPSYLVQLLGRGSSRSTWLFGACRAWVVDLQDQHNDWHPHEWLDRETELFAPMRKGGFNLLNQWMAPWEYLIVHHDRAELWKDDKGRVRRVGLAADSAWSPYQCLDQGRAAAFDDLVKLCEGDRTKPPIYLLLSPLPHQCLQVKEHPWGSQESGWSPGNDAGKQGSERLNGLSGFRPREAVRAAGGKLGAEVPRTLDVWDFFRADPRRPLDDWRSMLFDHQANFYRYLIARWGYSKAIGIWVLVDELDAVGDVVGNRRDKTGWWGHPSCRRWLGDIVNLFRGKLRRSDKLAYQGDPFVHPLHAATTSYGGEAGRGGNIDWDGGPKGARPDVFGFHWYPHWPEGSSWTDVWAYTIAGVAAYSRAPIGPAPKFISEFGAPDRDEPDDEPSFLYPTLYHHAIWAAIFSGHAGTPMDWDDGKQFGELGSRKRKGIFDEKSYPIDHVAQMKALRKFLARVEPGQVAACSGIGGQVQVSPANASTQVYALHESARRKSKSPGTVHGWLFARDKRPGAAAFDVTGLPPGDYLATWFDPWTGLPIPRMPSTPVKVEDAWWPVRIDAGSALKILREAAKPFPGKSRNARGQDVAFSIAPSAP
jgi:hypothetical protein